MTSKEKAIELVQSFDQYVIMFDFFGDDISKENKKKCALIAVDEILESLYEYDNRTEQYLKDQGIEYQSYELQNMDADFRYWNQVKSEIEKL
jgi:hypothetical protein